MSVLCQLTAMTNPHRTNVLVATRSTPESLAKTMQETEALGRTAKTKGLGRNARTMG